MKIKEGFILRSICGQNVISGEGSRNVNFSKLISLNETAAFLFEKVREKEFDAQMLADLILSEYEGVDRETALKDAQNLCDQWVQVGIAE